MRTTALRLSTLVLATLVCLLLAVLAPLIANYPVLEEPFAGASVMASPRDMQVITEPVALSEAPRFVIGRGVLYADGSPSSGAPVSRFVLDAPAFALLGGRTRARETADEAPRSALAPLLEQLSELAFETLTIRHGRIAVAGLDGSSEMVSEIDAEIKATRKGALSAKGSCMLHGQKLAFEGSFAPVDDTHAGRRPVKLTVKGALLAASLEGDVDTAGELTLAGSAELSTPSARQLARWFGVAVPTAPGVNVAALKGEFTFAKRNLAFEQAKLTIDGNEGGGTLALNLAGERPTIEGTLAFSALELAPYLDAARSQAYVFDRHTASWSAWDLSFPTIRQLDADLRLSAAKVTVHGYAFGRAAATIAVHDGKLLADIAELELPAGTASAQVTADVHDLVPRYGLRARIKDLDAGPAAAALFGSALFAGRSNLDVQLAASGRTPAELLRGLSGTAALAALEGGRLALDLKALRAAAKGAQGTAAALTSGQTSVERVEVEAHIQDGVLRTQTALARSGSSGVAAIGSVDLADQTLDLRLITKSDLAQDHPLSANDLEGGEQVVLRGGWSDPAVIAVHGDPAQ